MIKLINLLKRSYTYYSSKNIIKNKKIWVFGAIRGEKYMDNAKYLFEYVSKHSDIEAIWLSNNTELIKILKDKGYKAYKMYSQKGLSYAKKAKVAVITHRGNNENADLPFFAFNKDTKIVQLWHGIPLKKIGFDDKIFSFNVNEQSIKFKVKKLIKILFFPFLNVHQNYDLVLALSHETQKIFSSAFRTNEENIKITGYPRNDILFKKKKQQSSLKKIIYMPTFRDKIGEEFDLFVDYGFDIQQVEEFLIQNSMCLDIKLHPFNKPSMKLLKSIDKSKVIKFIASDDIYEILYEYDILITDYSSIYFDFLLLDRPIIFAPFDKENYLEKDREFYFEYNDVTPGPKANSWKEIMDLLEIFKDDTSQFKEERRLIKNRFHKYQDNLSSKRAYEAIVEIIKK